MEIKVPDVELEKLETLVKSKILDTETEIIYDTIVKIACAVMNSPIATVCLIDDEHVWFKSSNGANTTEIKREDSFSIVAVLNPDEPLIVKDATLDPRFINNPYVTGEKKFFGEEKVRFYVGMPFLIKGKAMGVLSIIDFVPREAMSPSHLDVLDRLAKLAGSEFEKEEFLNEIYEQIQELKKFPTIAEINADLFNIYQRFDNLAEKIKIRKQRIK